MAKSSAVQRASEGTVVVPSLATNNARGAKGPCGGHGGRAGTREDLRLVIADLNPVLRGWGQYFRTGNAADHFTDVDAYVERRLRGLRFKRANGRPAAGQLVRWDRPFFETLGLCRLRGTIQYPGAASCSDSKTTW